MILILGTMPSPASLRAGMYYSHPQNSFWRILGTLTGDEPGTAPAQRRAFLLRRHIAVWDTLESCVRPGALDGSIRLPVPNDIAGLVRACGGLRAVFLNGSAALRYYRIYHKDSVPLPFFGLPSTSPANARGGFAAKLEAWSALRPYLTVTQPR